MFSAIHDLKQSVKATEWTDLCIGVLGSALIAAASQLAVTLPYFTWIVPFTLQSQAVLLLGALLGPRRALLSVCFFLLEGACGLPVFAHGGSGIATLIGPRGGYLLSYLIVSVLVGALFARTKTPNLLLRTLFFCFGSALVLLSGATWLSAYVGMSSAWKLGVLPFVLTDASKNLLLAILLPTLWKSSWSRWFKL